MSQQKRMNFREFRQRFQPEEACEAYLFQQRWPDGFICPKCGGCGCYRLRGRREYICTPSHRQDSVTVGTVLHRTHLPLMVWFWAIYLIARDKQGILRVQLSRELEISYNSAWYLLHRLRRASRGTEKTSALAVVSLTKQGHPRFLKIQVPNWMLSQ
ncbi:MAG: transposase [Oscillospiraceae bacterium]|nr:transposase [Oscillospiraceae bacterium]